MCIRTFSVNLFKQNIPKKQKEVLSIFPLWYVISPSVLLLLTQAIKSWESITVILSGLFRQFHLYERYRKIQKWLRILRQNSSHIQTGWWTSPSAISSWYSFAELSLVSFWVRIYLDKTQVEKIELMHIFTLSAKCFAIWWILPCAILSWWSFAELSFVTFSVRIHSNEISVNEIWNEISVNTVILLGPLRQCFFIRKIAKNTKVVEDQ